MRLPCSTKRDFVQLFFDVAATANHGLAPAKAARSTPDWRRQARTTGASQGPVIGGLTGTPVSPLLTEVENAKVPIASLRAKRGNPCLWVCRDGSPRFARDDV